MCKHSNYVYKERKNLKFSSINEFRKFPLESLLLNIVDVSMGVINDGGLRRKIVNRLQHFKYTINTLSSLTPYELRHLGSIVSASL